MLSLGWRDILRPIRDLLPGRKHEGPTPEARKRQQKADALRGLVYLEDFEEIESWEASHAGAFQCSNVELVKRVKVDDAREGNGPRANVLLCHDASGNYHEWESSNGVGLQREEYCCEYLQYVETFVYFSHKLVSVPPAAWTNMLHRNGVKSLGTLLIEPQTAGIDRLLRSDEAGAGFTIVKRLAAMARTYGLDGWLLNIEQPFQPADWDLDALLRFITQLRHDLGPGGQVVWYDALTTSNKLEYQNALTASNLPFAKAAGSILINYRWTEGSASDSRALAARNGIDPAKVYFGIDVWAQNRQPGLYPPRRVTYPPKGGGGTNTGVAVAKLAELGLSAGVFAPAWSFEHFPGHGREVERVFWEGGELPAGLQCDCGDAGEQHRQVEGAVIAKHAREFCVGDGRWFYTAFDRAFRANSRSQDDAVPEGETEGEGKQETRCHSQLGAQQPLPTLHSGKGPLSAAVIPTSRSRMDGRLAGNVLEISTDWTASAQAGDDSSPAAETISLLKLSVPADGTLSVFVPFTVIYGTQSASYIQLWLSFRHDSGGRHSALLPPEIVTGGEEAFLGTVQCPCAHPTAACRLLEIGLRITPPVDSDDLSLGRLPLLHVTSIVINPEDYRTADVRLDNLRLERLDGTHRRLAWDWTLGPYASTDAQHAPLSRMCGPFAEFVVAVGDADAVLRAYASEVVLPAESLGHGGEVDVTITGYDCVGSCIATLTGRVRLSSTVPEDVRGLDSGPLSTTDTPG